MRAIVKGKWFVLLAWIAAVVVLAMTAPNMADLVREKGQITVPKGYSSSLAIDILKEVQQKEQKGNETSVALVFHRNGKLTDNDWKEAEKAIQQLENEKETLGITQIISPFHHLW